jgi:NitT/TauT family transport system permease protein
VREVFGSWLKRYTAVAAFLALWEILCRLGWLDGQFVPAFSRVMAYMVSPAGSKLWNNMGISLLRAGIGLLLAVLVAVPLGVMLAGWSDRARLALEPLAEWLSYINPFVIFHVVIFFLGAGELTKVTMIFWVCLWPITFSTLAGVMQVDQDIVKTARSLDLNRWQMCFKVLLPAAFPTMLTGLRLAAGYALLFLVAAEMMGASSGLGWLISRAQSNYQLAELFAAVTLIAVIAVMIDAGLETIGKRLGSTP